MINAERFLIVNADDFGQTEAINAGIIEAYTHGIVTSASLMVRHPASAHAAELARSHPRLSVGLHFDLGEWACKGDDWHQVYSITDEDDPTTVAAEVAAQLEAFELLTGHPPTHIDSHQHIHRAGPTSKLLAEAARRLGVPLRGASGIAYRGDFYGQTAKGRPMPTMITVDALVEFLKTLPLGWIELGCHPGLPDPDMTSMYTQERPIELATLCSPQVREVIAQNAITLCSFRDAAGRPAD